MRYATHLWWIRGESRWHLVVKESKFAGAHESPQKVHSFFLTNHRHAETLTRRKPGVCKKWDEEKERWQVELATGETKLVKAANRIVDMRPSAPQSPPELEDTKPDGPTQYED